MEIERYMKKLIIFTLLIMITVFVILKYSNESSTQEPPKRAKFVRNNIGENKYYV